MLSPVPFSHSTQLILSPSHRTWHPSKLICQVTITTYNTINTINIATYLIFIIITVPDIMANVGHYTDRNPNLRAAGISTIKNPEDLEGAKGCFVSLDTAEEAEHQIRAHCRRHKPKPYGKRTPISFKSTIEETLNQNLRTIPFATIQKARENSYLRRPSIGEAKQTFSKPANMTNLSHTYGQVTPPEESVYSVILPPKTSEQVNREYADNHDQHIISHNHYFPSEQINRRYSQQFNRFDTFGVPTYTDPSGIKVKNCLNESEEHLKIIKKPKQDIDKRTKAPLGKKFGWYPYDIPKNMTFGIMSHRDVSVQSLLEYTSPSHSTEKMIGAISHLNHLRNFLQRRDDFSMNQLLMALDQKDTEGLRQLPLAQIIQIMRKMNIPADSVKIRTAVSFFRLFVDENCCGERVKYEKLCDLLSVLKPLPMIGSITPEPEKQYNKVTTYRQLCADLAKKRKDIDCKPVNRTPIDNTSTELARKAIHEDTDLAKTPTEEIVNKHPHRTPIQEDMDNTRVVDIIRPDPPILCGLWPSDFKQPRAKDEMGRIFNGIVTKDHFDKIWQSLMEKQQDPKEMASIRQFRAEMISLAAEKKRET